VADELKVCVGAIGVDTVVACAVVLVDPVLVHPVMQITPARRETKIMAYFNFMYRQLIFETIIIVYWICPQSGPSHGIRAGLK